MPRVFDQACGSADAVLNDEFMQMSVVPRAGVVASRESRDSASPRMPAPLRTIISSPCSVPVRR
jgi:hypothetical protein